VPWHGVALVNPPAEECDDGNTNNNDGCDNTCHLTAPQNPACNTFTVTPTTGSSSTQFNFTVMEPMQRIPTYYYK